MAEQLRYDGKVVLITGAGNGLGRAHALDFAARGAHVVVNDLGGGADGSGRANTAADRVVAEIRALGGEAVANHDSVEDGERIVQAALDAYGTLDVVLNNAGILRDASLHKMTQEQWELILRVHLGGSFRVTRAAWPVLRDKGYGRVIFTSSGAGIYGNFGQANYAAAKLGLCGFANALAIEGRGRGILVNTIAPVAASRLTEKVLPPELMQSIKPEYVTPLVSWLCHERCAETGGLFEVGAGYVSKLRWERSRGEVFDVGKGMNAEQVAARWERITDFSDAEHPTSINDTFNTLLKAAQAPRRRGNKYLDLDTVARAETVVSNEYGPHDLALYAFGVGAGRDPLDPAELRYVYDSCAGLAPLPTWAVMPSTNAMLQLMRERKPLLDGLNYGLERLLHGEQYTEIRAPLPLKARLSHRFRLKAAYDKDPNAVLVFAVSSCDDSGRELAYNEITAFVRGIGGWGGERGPARAAEPPPAREPDAQVEEKTDPHQALLYRLCGDWNPMHADPAFARAAGFERPILHGLCTYGYVGRHVLRAFCGNDPARFRSIRVRFAGSVFPGETLVTRMWRESGQRVVVEVKAKERDQVVIRNGVVELSDPV